MFTQVYSDIEELAVFCGRENTDTERVPASDIITSPGNVLSVAFRSDFSNEERYFGFEAHFSAIGECINKQNHVFVSVSDKNVSLFCLSADVDECRDRNDEDLVCDHFCHNYIGGFYCSCRFGFLLHSDNRTCKGSV